MTLGYRGNADWRDMSEYVVHFAKAGPDPLSAYTSMLSILSSGTVRAHTRFGSARNLDALGDTQQSACFSEIPLDRLDRLVTRRSQYGVGFRQDVLAREGGARVWYLDRGSPAEIAFQELKSKLIGPPMDTENSFWRLTPFIDIMGSYGAGEYRFEWEREWRVPGGLHFSPDTVAFLFIPESLQGQARLFFDQAEASRSGPNYRCPFLDPSWPDYKIQWALSSVTS